MPLFLLLALLALSLTAAAQPDRVAKKQEGTPPQGASSGASGDAARARAGPNASVEGGAALGATGISPRPAAKTEQAEKEERKERRRAPRK